MSEFSDSYHLLGSAADAIELLRDAGARGAVLAGPGKWTAIVPHPSDGPRVVAVNEGVLLHYQFGGDHGCWVRLFDGPKEVGKIEQNWESGTGSFDVAPWLRAKACDAATAEAISELVAAPAHAGLDVYEVAQALALTHYAWLSSSDYALPDQLESHAPGAVTWVPERPEEGDPGEAHEAMLDAVAHDDDDRRH